MTPLGITLQDTQNRPAFAAGAKIASINTLRHPPNQKPHRKFYSSEIFPTFPTHPTYPTQPTDCLLLLD
jgi:hypothetical protein